MYAKVLISIPLDEDFTYLIPPSMNVRPGCRVVVPFGSRSVTGYVTDIEQEYPVPYSLKEIIRVVDKDEPVFTPELVTLARFVSRMYLCSAGQALDAMIPSGRRDTDSCVLSSESNFRPVDRLSRQQEAALEKINSATGMYYLYGVTGSGKSEVFLRAAEEVVSQGRQVIYLVPEITLTHQLVDDVMQRFDNRVALLHSALTPSQRLRQWHKIMRHEVDLVIGARSAVFAPCINLGLIIMDEEHENSYKSGSTPRYHARQIAQKRASMNNVSFIMGSATPSLEAWNMMERGIVKRIDMPERVGGGVRPEIEVVSMLGQDRCISTRLEDEIRRTLLDGRSVILFLNRRGYSYYYHCNSCGHVVECPHCSVAMTYHKADGRLQCHYCGFSMPLSDTCFRCGSTDMSVAGHGTEKVEEEIRKLFPSASCARLDADVAAGDKEKVRDVIHAFRDGLIDILLGTQMVAKGFNFPSLSLVGVINADSTLSVPDFRSEERTFSLLEQVAGRAGRYDSKGKVLIQTFRPQNKAILAVENNSGEDFYKGEMEVRKILHYPPYSRFLSLVFRSRVREKAHNGALMFSSILKEITDALPHEAEVTVTGVSPCVIEKKSGSWRYQVLLSSSSILLLDDIVRKALDDYKAPGGLYIEIDVDPLSLM